MAVFFDGTGGGGDSILHYQYARYAGKHPENFFYHWAKPVFTLLAFPFSQFGFIGIKLFNIFCSTGAAWLGYLTLKTMNTPYRWMYGLLLFCAPLYVTVTLSGLTEPLSALMIMATIYACVKERFLAASVLVSFLPFVRSEGLIIIGVLAVYLIIKQQYRLLPWLAAGHLVLSITGSFFHHDLLWVFRKIPYARLGSGYGKGSWSHFINQLFFQIGPFLYVLLILGLLLMITNLLSNKKRSSPFFVEKFWLVTGIFMAFSMAHTAFWALGIFNSMGLVRVFVTVIPLAILIVIWGISQLMQWLPDGMKKTEATLAFLIPFIALILPFMKGPYSYKLPDDFVTDSVQRMMKDAIVPYLEKNHADKTWVVSDSDISFFGNRDPFDKTQMKWFYEHQNLADITPKEVIICDSWFAPVEWGWDEQKIESQPGLIKDTVFITHNAKGAEVRFAIFTRK